MTRRQLLQTTALAASQAVFRLPTIPSRPSPAGSTSRCAGRSSTAPKTMPPKWTSLSGWIISSASMPTPSASPPAAWWRSIRRRSNITARAGGSPSAPTTSARSFDGCRKLGMVVVARTDPHATYEDVYRDHPDWIAVDAEGQQAPALGNAGHVGDLRARTLQLRVHDRGHQGDRLHLSRGGRHLQQSLGRLGHVLLRALRPKLPGLLRHGPAAHQQPTRSGAPQLHRLARKAPVRTVATVGRRDPQDQSRGALHRQLRRRERRARYARRSASLRRRCSPTGRAAAA